jgi:hypothetical protein
MGTVPLLSATEHKNRVTIRPTSKKGGWPDLINNELEHEIIDGKAVIKKL